jgi:hypothetical protein
MNQKEQEDLPVFHNEIFETTNPDIPLETRTLQMIRKQRGQRLTSEKVTNLVSPGSHILTIDDDDLSENNTRYLFKNLYGETLLTSLFFSKLNILNIQNVIKFNVHKETNYIIDKQSMNELMIIMRAVFLEYSRHPKLITPDMSQNEKDILLMKYKMEVSRLNTIVINQVVPNIVSQLQQYIDYLKDASEQPYYMDKPQNVSIKGQKQYRSITQVLTGSDL